MNNIVFNDSDSKQISPLKIVSEDYAIIVLQQSNIQNLMHFTVEKYLYVTSSSFLYLSSIYSIVYIDTVDAKNFVSSIAQNGFFINSKDLIIQNSFFENSILVKTSKPASVYGGFFKISINELLITNSLFSNSNSTFGGAFYVVGLGKFKLNVKKCNFTNSQTTIYKEYGYGGAFYIDSTQTEITDINFEKVKFQNIQAKTSGAIIYLSSGLNENNITLDKLEIRNVFAPSASIIKYNFLSKDSSFTLMNSNLTSDEIKIKAYIQQIFDSSLTQNDHHKTLQESFNLFYLVVGEYGTAYLINNNLINLQNHQGYFHSQFGNVTDEGNKIINTPYAITPFIHVELDDKNVYESKGSRYLNNQFNKNFIQIQNVNSGQNSYIYIKGGNATIFDLRISSVVCDNCNSIIQLSDVYGEMKQSYFKNNSYFMFGFVNIYQSSQQTSVRQLQTIDKTSYLFSLTTFIENKGETGGAIYSVNQQIQLVNCLLSNNTATYAGAIYFKSLENMNQELRIIGSTIQYNKAKYYGGIQSIDGFVSLLENTKINYNYDNNQINNLVQYPTKMKVSLVYESKTKQKTKIKLIPNEKDNKITINEWSSNKSINGYLFVELLDNNNDFQNEIPYEMDKDKISYANIKLISLSKQNQSGSSDGQIQGATSVQYNPIDKGYSFNSIILRQDQGKSIFLQLTSNDIKIPVYDNQRKQISFCSDYSVNIEIKMRECQIGEQYQSTIKECVSCPAGTYSLGSSTLDCKTCPYQDGVQVCEGRDKIILSKGYWRPSLDSDKISECSNFKNNCLGGYNAGNNSCAEGHVGALCESCDIYGEFWQESYSSNGSYKCGKCSDVSRNAYKITFIIFYNLLAILFSVNSTQTSAKNQLLGLYVQKLGFISRNSILKKEETSIILKIFTTYIQLISVITTFKLDIPTILGDITGNIGNPIESMSYSLDCSLVQIQNRIPLVYFRLIWSLSLPVMFFIVFMVLFVSYLAVTKQKLDYSMHWISFTYIFLSLQPSIITQYISGEYYMKSDVSYKCFTQDYNVWSLVFAVPVLIFWGIVIPAFLFFQLYVNRHKVCIRILWFIKISNFYINQLNQMTTKKKFGFLFNEYKQQSYFWEMIKVLMKTLVIIFLNMYDDNIQIKGILVLLIICCYWLLTHKCQPYIDLKYNKLDKYSTTTVLISIILAIFIYDNPYAYQIWLSYLLLVIINSICLIKMIKITILGYSKKFENIIRMCLEKMNELFPFLSKIFNINLLIFYFERFKKYLISVQLNYGQFLEFMQDIQDKKGELQLKVNKTSNPQQDLKSFQSIIALIEVKSETLSVVQSEEMQPQSDLRFKQISRSDSAQESQRSQTSNTTDPFDKQSFFNGRFYLNKQNQQDLFQQKSSKRIRELIR